MKMGIIRRFWSWFKGLFNKDAFIEVPELSEPEVEADVDEPADEAPDVEEGPETIEKLESEAFATDPAGILLLPGFWANANVLTRALSVLAEELGRSVVLVSGYRSEYYNRWAGGKEDSAHLEGAAADFYVPGLTLLELQDAVEMLIAAKRIPEGEVLVQGSFIHYCVRKNT
jgi:hypothetical protein